MTVEQEIFSRKRFDAEALKRYGFSGDERCLSLSTCFHGGDFTAEIHMYKDGAVRGRVIDNMTDEEYTPLRMPNYTGAFVGSVREEYKELLLDIAGKCCRDVAFASDQANRIAAAILDKYAAEPDFPWDEGSHETSGVFRHGSSGKWFGLIMNVDRRMLDKNGAGDRVDVINLKADESKVTLLHRVPGIFPAYHMNHDKWISVFLDDTLSDSEIMDLVSESFELTQSRAGVLNEKLIREVLTIADGIPQGHVMTYGQIAAAAGMPKNARLVGKIMSMADRYGEHPCHRVVNSAGRTVPGWIQQRALLEAEGVEFRANGCVDMKRYQLRSCSD